jgi:hypothetical protein
MSHPALNLTARDFDAYAAEKATSNAYSRPRLEVKQRALAWARAVVARLAELGLPADVHGSDEHPTLRNKKRVDCQWVFFWRDQAARDELDRLQGRGRTIAAEIDDPSPFTRHAFLALRIDPAAVEVCFAVHPEAQVDVDNLRARLLDTAPDGAAAELMDALHALPEQFTVGVSPDDRVPASALTLDAFRALIPRAEGGQVPLWIGWSVPRETALEHAALFAGDAPSTGDAVVVEAPAAADLADRPPTLDEQLEDAIIALAPIYRLVAWSRDNDRIALDRRIESAEQERARTHAEAEAQTERWRAEQAEARKKSAEQARARTPGEPLLVHDGPHARGQRAAGPPRRPSLDTLFAKKAPPAAPLAPAAPAAPRPTPATPSSSEARAEPVASVASAGGVKSSGGPAAPPSEGNGERAAPVIEKGVKVRVLSGPFADKIGVLGELDGRGGARVHLGLLSTRLEVADLEPVVESRERPALQSSHRRPLAPAPRKARG